MGKGTYGEVFLAYSKSSFERIAVKVISKKALDKNQLGYLKKEVEISKKLDQANIIRTFGY